MLSTLLLFAKTDSQVDGESDAPAYEKVGFFQAYERLTDWGVEKPTPAPLFYLPLMEFEGRPPMPLVPGEAPVPPVTPIREDSLQATEIQKLFARSSVPLRLDKWQIEMELPKTGLRRQVITVRQIHVLDFLASKVIEKLGKTPCATTDQYE